MWLDRGRMSRRPVKADGLPEPWEHRARDHGARWGHEWAAVAWMAAAVEIVIEQSGYQPGSLDDPKGEIDELAGLPPF